MFGVPADGNLKAQKKFPRSNSSVVDYLSKAVKQKKKLSQSNMTVCDPFEEKLGCNR